MNADEIVFIVEIDAESGGYSAVCHRYGIYTQGEDDADLRAMVVDAVQCRFEGVADRPNRIRLHFVHDEVIVH